MINTLQLILAIPLFEISFPADAILFNQLLFSISSFDVLPTDQINSGVFGLKDDSGGDDSSESDGFSYNFSEMDIFEIDFLIWTLSYLSFGSFDII